MVVRNDVTAGPLPKSDDYFVHRAMLSYPFGNGMTVQLNVQNFTNEKYFTNVRNTTNGWAVPGEGRSARLSLFYSRSEEHTSELQSLMRISYAVFCLKKK